MARADGDCETQTGSETGRTCAKGVSPGDTRKRIIPNKQTKRPSAERKLIFAFCVVCEGEERTSTRRGTSWSIGSPSVPGTFVYGNFTVSVRKTESQRDAVYTGTSMRVEC